MRLLLYAIPLFWAPYTCLGGAGRTSFTYPVASYDRAGMQHVLVLYQQDLNNLELYDWNRSTGYKTKAISAQYTPAAVTMLPDGSGFSFVDNGRIRIKYFHKRSVKTLDIYEPIYGIELVNWLDSKNCYFHAQSDGYYGIFMMTIEEELATLRSVPYTDCMFPVIREGKLFYIMRTMRRQKADYSIACSDLQNKENPWIIAWFGEKSLLFLSMTTVHEGFVMARELLGDFEHFHYYQLTKKVSTWACDELFTFKIPKKLLDELYESLIPIVPRVNGPQIYYSSYDESSGFLAGYMYDLQKKKSSPVVEATGHIFPPLFCGGRALYGGTINIFDYMQ